MAFSRNQCSAYTHSEGSWSGRCKRHATYLLLHKPSGTPKRAKVEYLCSQHAKPLFQQAALPGSIEAVAVWNPALAENGWYWPS